MLGKVFDRLMKAADRGATVESGTTDYRVLEYDARQLTDVAPR
jgi:hypothetical protein